MQWGPEADAKVCLSSHNLHHLLDLKQRPPRLVTFFFSLLFEGRIWSMLGEEADFYLQLFIHVLRIHNIKIDYGALAVAMGNGELLLLVHFS